MLTCPPCPHLPCPVPPAKQMYALTDEMSNGLEKQWKYTLLFQLQDASKFIEIERITSNDQ